MSGTSRIEWTDATWNPVTGCSKVSQGCKFCYAERIFSRPYPGRGFTDVRTHPERLEWPMKWHGSKQAKSEGRPSRIFVNSMSDLFHEGVPTLFIEDVLVTMLTAPQHAYQILTKRPQRMRDFIARLALSSKYYGPWPLSHVWLGASVEDQATADERIPILLQTPAAVRFVSYEPALGPVDLSRFLPVETAGGVEMESWLNWIIAGGESGPNARPSHPDWFRDVRDQCQEAGVPFFMKQWGEWAPKGNFDGIANWDHATSHALVNTTGEYTEVHGPDDPDEEFGLRCCDLDGNDGAAAMAKVGKKSAGRLLDGREWNEFPK